MIVIGPSGQIFYGAPAGFHDDCVIALSLANHRRWETENCGKMLPVAVNGRRRFVTARRRERCLVGWGRICGSYARRSEDSETVSDSSRGPNPVERPHLGQVFRADVVPEANSELQFEQYRRTPEAFCCACFFRPRNQVTADPINQKTSVAASMLTKQYTHPGQFLRFTASPITTTGNNGVLHSIGFPQLGAHGLTATATIIERISLRRSPSFVLDDTDLSSKSTTSTRREASQRCGSAAIEAKEIPNIRNSIMGSIAKITRIPIGLYRVHPCGRGVKGG